jgi:hypothetical protein
MEYLNPDEITERQFDKIAENNRLAFDVLYAFLNGVLLFNLSPSERPLRYVGIGFGVLVVIHFVFLSTHFVAAEKLQEYRYVDSSVFPISIETPRYTAVFGVFGFAFLLIIILSALGFFIIDSILHGTGFVLLYFVMVYSRIGKYVQAYYTLEWFRENTKQTDQQT